MGGMTPDEMKALADRLAWYGWRLGETAKKIESQSRDTTWNGGARRRFDADLEQQLKAARQLDRKIEGAATELKKAATRLQRIHDGLRADERDVRNAYPDFLMQQGITGSIAAVAHSKLPGPLDPQWAEIARRVLGRSHTQGYL
jgi:uncharacterized protein YukE